MSGLVIIGNGVAGTTVARHVRKRSDMSITIISGETDHFFSRTALMYIYMGHMKYEDTKPYEDWFWKKNRIELERGWVSRVDSEARCVHFSDGKKLEYEQLVLATGSSSNRFGWPGQDLKGVQGLYSYQDLETLEENSGGAERAVIVGGGLIGIEMAEMLHSRGIAVTLLVREKNFWDIVLPLDEARMINREVLSHGFDLRLETELKQVLADDSGRVRAVETNDGKEIPCQIVGLTVGVHPNIGFLEDSGIDTGRGILINEYFETSAANIFAIGDCAEHRAPLPGRRPVEQVWYTGKIMGEQLAANLTSARVPYDPGIWFNSAKFLDIEYQTYGSVPAQLPDEEESLYWEDGAGKRSVRINYRREDRVVTGFNLFGVRGRYSICESWLDQGAAIEHVLENLGAMNFDPEFFQHFEEDVLSTYRAQHSESKVTLKTKKGLFSPYVRQLRS